MIFKSVIISILVATIPLFLIIHKEPTQILRPTSVNNENIPAGTGLEKPSFVAKTPTLDRIFSDNHSGVTALPPDRIRTIIVTGDVIPARFVNFQASQKKDFRWPYLKTAEVLKKADITFINMETPLIDRCPVTQEGMIFCGDSGNVEGLLYAGVDITSLANNHAGNYGLIAVEETKRLLNTNKILTTGIDGAEVIDVRGVKFAFLGYNDISKPQLGVANVDEEKIKSDIALARKKADVVIITYHWGVEYRDKPDDRQKYLGRFAIDAGADLVIGNHPHWIQPVEIYKDKLIAYAHGNFVFDQEWSLKTRQGVVGKYTFYDNQLIDVEYLPVLIENYGQPRFLTGNEKNTIIENMKAQSEDSPPKAGLLYQMSETPYRPAERDWYWGKNLSSGVGEGI
ncbi:MAG: CapA family protein [bacterium]|nr:CapA family protein [bacterium]